MKQKKILLVANDNMEILNIQRELTEHSLLHSIHLAKTGLEALSLLMGCSSPMLENYLQTGKVQPDLLIIDADTMDIHAVDLLCIMQKYYSLQKIKIYLITSDPSKLELPEAGKCSVTGYLPKPFRLDHPALDTEKFKSELSLSGLRASIPLIGFTPFRSEFKALASGLVKAKTIVLQMSGVFGVKAACMATVVFAGVLMSSSVVSKRHPEPENTKQPAGATVVTEIASENATEPATDTAIGIREAEIPGEQCAPPVRSVAQHEAKKALPAEPRTLPETSDTARVKVIHERLFKIRVVEEADKEISGF